VPVPLDKGPAPPPRHAKSPYLLLATARLAGSSLVAQRLPLLLLAEAGLLQTLGATKLPLLLPA